MFRVQSLSNGLQDSFEEVEERRGGWTSTEVVIINCNVVVIVIILNFIRFLLFCCNVGCALSQPLLRVFPRIKLLCSPTNLRKVYGFFAA